MISPLSTQARLAISSPTLLWVGLVGCAAVLVAAMFTSIAFGAADIDIQSILAALFSFDPDSTNHLIIRSLRLPRAAIAALVGAALAVAGAIMQGITRNPMGDTGILGINTGAAFAVVMAVSLLKVGSFNSYVWFAFGGGALTAALVYALSALRQGNPSPLRLTIAGAALTALISSLTTALLIFNQRTLEEVRFWLVGSIAGRNLGLLGQVAPYLLVGLVVALLLGRQITTLSLGEDVAKSLGQRTAQLKALCIGCVVLLAGSSVAVAGPIAFIGLVIPHFVRFYVGVDYRWILPYAALCGGILLLVADVGARVLAKPVEIPVGILTALIGAPFFIFLIRQKARSL